MDIIIEACRKIKRFWRISCRFYVLNNAFTGSLDKLPIEKNRKIR